MTTYEKPAKRLWHWAESNHWAVQFEGLPRRFPWFNSDAPPPQNRSGGGPDTDFPIERLYEAVEAMLADPPDEAPDPRFASFVKYMEAGSDLARTVERNDYLGAASAIRTLECTGHKCASLLFNKAFVYGQTGREDEVRALYKQALELAPDCEMLWRHYADASEKAGDKAEAIRANFEALRLLPHHQEATLALQRLGEMFLISPTDAPDKKEWMTKAEARAKMEEVLARYWNDAEALLGVTGPILHDNIFPDLGLRAMERCVELNPDNAEARRNLGVALRVNGRAQDSLNHLYAAMRRDPKNPWIYFHLAESYLALGDTSAAWEMLPEALDCDRNHKPALHLKFMARQDRTAEQKEQDIADYAKPQPESGYAGSWQGYLLAAESAWARGARQEAVGHAASAYKIAPDDETVFLTYTGMLAETGENEWVAALTKPRLRAGETNPRAVMNFVRALDAMGLRDEALQTCRASLVERKLDADSRQAFVAMVDRWTQRFATGDVAAALHPGGVALQRNICQVKDGKVLNRFFEAGMGLPQRREIPVKFQQPRTEFDVFLEERYALDDPAPAQLGVFTVGEIDPARIDTEALKLSLLLDTAGQLTVGAQQGDRKLRVIWSLYPPPRHDAG